MIVKCLVAACLAVAPISCAPPIGNNAAPATRAKVCESFAAPKIPKSAPPNSTYLAKDKPIPTRYRSGDVGVRIEFRTADEIDRICAANRSGLPSCGVRFYACVQTDGWGNETMYMPNPCDAAGNEYTALFCHETAHLRGWPATHGD